MQTRILAFALAVGLAGSGAAFAQQDPAGDNRARSGPQTSTPGAAASQASRQYQGLDQADRTFVEDYLVRNRRPSVRFEGDLVVGAQVPETVTVYEFSGRPSLSGYRYVYLNDRPVIVQNRRIVGFLP